MQQREIKFRAWIKEEKRMIDVDMEYATGFFYSNANDFILLQYTGLKDKNRVEIYEGDIIDDGDGVLGIVKWRKYGFEQDMINTLGWWLIQEQGKIIGNIYENPKLLKRK